MNTETSANDHNCKKHAIASLEDSGTPPTIWFGRMSKAAQRLIWIEMSRRLRAVGASPDVIRAAGRHLVDLFDGDQWVAMKHITLAVIGTGGVESASDAIWEALREH